MRGGSIGNGIVAAGMIVLVSVAAYAGTQRSEPSTDTRRRLILPRPQRDKVLAEMRQMLGSIRGILHGLAANDLPTVEKAARVSGMERAADPQLRKKLPEGFLQFGLQTHEGFDRLADKVKAGGTREEVIKELAGLTNNCVGCHAAYRLDEAR